MINEKSLEKIKRIILTAVTGAPESDYTRVAIAHDRQPIKQLRYGYMLFSEDDGLWSIISRYNARRAALGYQPSELATEAGKLVGTGELPKRCDIIAWLASNGENGIMEDVQDEVAYQRYFEPAERFCRVHGAEIPIVQLVVTDSYVQSGRVPGFLRSRFEISLNNACLESKIEWCRQYVNARIAWKKVHENESIRKTVYRDECYRDILARGDYMLEYPVTINGVEIK